MGYKLQIHFLIVLAHFLIGWFTLVVCAKLIVRIGGNELVQKRRNYLPCIVRTSQTNVVQSKGWLSDGCYLT